MTLRRIPVLLTLAAFLLCTPPVITSHAWEVESGSEGNVLALELFNLDGERPIELIDIQIVNQPDWIQGCTWEAISHPNMNPGELTVITLHYDVSSRAGQGDLEVMELALIPREGDGWWWEVPFQVVTGADAVQSDCCSSLVISPTTVEEEMAEAEVDPGGAGLSLEAYPNPSNPHSAIQFELTRRAEVTVSVHDVTGRLVRRVASGAFEAGMHRLSWDGFGDSGEPMASGVYLVRVEAAGETAVTKLLLTR